MLEFFAEAGFRDAELVAVFGDGAAGDLVAFGCHAVHKFVVGEGLALVLGVDAFLERLLELAGGDFLTVLILQSF